jgi:hypothetical protein
MLTVKNDTYLPSTAAATSHMTGALFLSTIACLVLCRRQIQRQGYAFALHWWFFVRLFPSLDLVSKEWIFVIGSLKWRRPPTKGMQWPASQTISFSTFSTTSRPAPCAPTNVSIAHGSASSLITIRCYPRLWPASSMTPRTASETSPASLVNAPPTCPSCPSSRTM